MRHFGSGKGFCQRLGCFKYATKIVGGYCLCDKHADEYIFIGGAKETPVSIAELRGETEEHYRK